MFRRLFWFVLGAVCGVLGVEWARRRANEIREAITVESVARLGARTAVIVWHRLVAAVSYLTGLVAPGDGQPTDVPVPSTSTSTTQRRHIAPQPRSTHR
ncbi:MAG: hypothetical protein ACO28P_00075 [Ilumatobacteraceae bacterium]|jgi:hypothetical protein